MSCDIIIPVWNQLESTRECIEAIAKTTRYPHRLILIDNGSEAGTKAYLEGLAAKGPAGVVLIRNEKNLGYIKAVNQGMRISDAPYVCLMNNDTIPGIGWLERLVAFAEAHKDVGLMNPLCNGHRDLSIDEYAAKVAGNGGQYMEMNQCFGHCMLIKREVIKRIGYLDESFGIGGYDDTDYSMRAGLAGYRCVSVHSSYVYHKEHVSFNAMGKRDDLVKAGHEAYFKKWPRHLRVGVKFSVNNGVDDHAIEDVLETLLFMAREWCWINFWITGDKSENKLRLDLAMKKIKMPSHQNIKFNFMPARFAGLQVLVRLIERSLGTKARKHYDAVLVDDDRSSSLMKTFYYIHRTRIFRIKPGTGMAATSGSITKGIRNQEKR